MRFSDACSPNSNAEVASDLRPAFRRAIQHIFSKLPHPGLVPRCKHSTKLLAYLKEDDVAHYQPMDDASQLPYFHVEHH